MDPVTFKIGDDPQVYALQYDFNELCDAEPIAECNLLRAIAGGEVTAIQTRGLLYACLKKAHPLVTLDEAGSLLSRDLTTVLNALGEALKTVREKDPTVDHEMPTEVTI